MTWLIETGAVGIALIVVLYVLHRILAARGDREKRVLADIWTARETRAERMKGPVSRHCPSRALRELGGGYACQQDVGHAPPHRLGAVVWFAEDDILIDARWSGGA